LPFFLPYIAASERTVNLIELILSPLVLEFYGLNIKIIRKQFGVLWSFDFYCKIGILKTLYPYKNWPNPKVEENEPTPKFKKTLKYARAESQNSFWLTTTRSTV